jgi:hypothetical protein
MPVLQYRLAHPQARLSGADIQILCSWTGQATSNSGVKEDRD